MINNNNNNNNNDNNTKGVSQKHIQSAHGLTMGMRLPESKRNCTLVSIESKTSIWWREFMLYPSSLTKGMDSKYVYVCKICYETHKNTTEVPESKWEVRLGADRSPTTLKKHLIHNHRSAHDKLVAEQIQKNATESIKESENMNAFVSSSQQTMFLEKLTNWITNNYIPISVVESTDFKDVIATITKRKSYPQDPRWLT